VQRAEEAGAELLLVELGTVSVGLHHLRHPHVGGLEGGETLFARQATATAADAGAILVDARVDHLGVGVAA
jgi:ABC-type cobalamin/Fe3+-siderophores transport system ATPase subunit